MSAMNSLLTLLRECVDAKRMSVAEIARQCDCTRQHIYQILHEKQQPTMPLAEKLAEVLGAEITVKTKSRRKISA